MQSRNWQPVTRIWSMSYELAAGTPGGPPAGPQPSGRSGESKSTRRICCQTGAGDREAAGRVRLAVAGAVTGSEPANVTGTAAAAAATSAFAATASANQLRVPGVTPAVDVFRRRIGGS